MRSSYLSLIFVTIILSLCLSSCESTEKCAKKESGKEFNIWNLTYNADDNYVYWPQITLGEGSIDGSLRTIITEEYDSFFSLTAKTSTVDTTFSNSSLQVIIKNTKSTEDASRYFITYFRIKDSKGYFQVNTKETVIFNPGQRDSVIISSRTNDNGFLSAGRENSEKVLTMLCGKKPVNVQISNSTYSKDFLDYTYYDRLASFTIEGSPKLITGLKLLQTRMELAEKESQKYKIKHN